MNVDHSVTSTTNPAARAVGYRLCSRIVSVYFSMVRLAQLLPKRSREGSSLPEAHTWALSHLSHSVWGTLWASPECENLTNHSWHVILDLWWTLFSPIINKNKGHGRSYKSGDGFGLRRSKTFRSFPLLGLCSPTLVSSSVWDSAPLDTLVNSVPHCHSWRFFASEMG